MATVFDRVWSFLSLKTDIWDRFLFLTNYRVWIFGTVFALALAAGCFVYRMYFSITFFYLFVTISTVLLKPHMAWNYVVAFFSVVGVIFTFLSYRWSRAGGIILSAALGAMTAWMAVLFFAGEGLGIGSIAFILICAIASAVCAFFFLKPTVCVLTAVFGGFGLAELFGVLPAGIAAAALGAAFQLFLTKWGLIWKKRT